MGLSRARQNGNIIFIILIATFLFAALSYAVSQSTRVGSEQGMASGEKRLIAYKSMIDFANAVGMAVQELKLRGCADTQISFENPVASGYVNTSAPSDKSCHVFDPAGGGLSYQPPSPDMLDSAHSSKTNFGQWVFSGRYCIRNIGTGVGPCVVDNNELLAILLFVKPEICEKVRVEISQTAAIGSWNYTNGALFQGVYGPGAASLPSSHHNKEKTACGQFNGEYYFYHTLLVR